MLWVGWLPFIWQKSFDPFLRRTKHGEVAVFYPCCICPTFIHKYRFHDLPFSPFFAKLTILQFENYRHLSERLMVEHFLKSNYGSDALPSGTVGALNWPAICRSETGSCLAVSAPTWQYLENMQVLPHNGLSVWNCFYVLGLLNYLENFWLHWWTVSATLLFYFHFFFDFASLSFSKCCVA